MHLKTMFPALVAVVFTATASFSPAADKKEKAPPPTATESALIAKARASYPLKKCLVSDEDLGDIAEATPYIYHQAGKPDRVIFVCCEGCIDDFKQDPAKYLKKVDDAAAGKKSGSGKKKSDAKH